jgi:hypothetical protein
MVKDFLYKMFGYTKVTANSVLETAGGSPVQGAPVVLSYAKFPNGSWSQDGASSTDSLGAVSNVVYLKSGRYSFRMTFAGTSSYGPSLAEKDGVKV